jgi:hypothetical protein
MAINTKALTAVAITLAKAYDAREKASTANTPALVSALGGADKEAARAALRPLLAPRYGVEGRESKTGKMMFPSDTEEGKRLHNCVAYIVSLAYPKSSEERVEIEVPAEVQAWMDAVVKKTNNGYEECGTILRSALAIALSNLKQKV